MKIFCIFLFFLQCKEDPRFYLSIISFAHSRVLSLSLTSLPQIFSIVRRLPKLPVLCMSYHCLPREKRSSSVTFIFSLYAKSLFILISLLSQKKEFTIFTKINCMPDLLCVYFFWHHPSTDFFFYFQITEIPSLLSINMLICPPFLKTNKKERQVFNSTPCISFTVLPSIMKMQTNFLPISHFPITL